MDFWSREGNLRFCPYLLGGNFFDYFLDWRSKNDEFLDIRPCLWNTYIQFRASSSKKGSKLAKMSNRLSQPKNDPPNSLSITFWSPKYKKRLKLAYQAFKVPNSDQKSGIWAYLSSQIFGNKSTYLLTYILCQRYRWLFQKGHHFSPGIWPFCIFHNPRYSWGSQTTHSGL